MLFHGQVPGTLGAHSLLGLRSLSKFVPTACAHRVSGAVGPAGPPSALRRETFLVLPKDPAAELGTGRHCSPCFPPASASSPLSLHSTQVTPVQPQHLHTEPPAGHHPPPALLIPALSATLPCPSPPCPSPPALITPPVLSSLSRLPLSTLPFPALPLTHLFIYAIVHLPCGRQRWVLVFRIFTCGLREHTVQISPAHSPFPEHWGEALPLPLPLPLPVGPTLTGACGLVMEGSPEVSSLGLVLSPSTAFPALGRRRWVYGPTFLDSQNPGNFQLPGSSFSPQRSFAPALLSVFQNRAGVAVD